MFQIGERQAAPAGLDDAMANLRQMSTAALGHLTDFGFAEGLAPIFRPCKAVGRAFTVASAP